MYLRPYSKTFRNKRKRAKLLRLASTGKYSAPKLAKLYKCNRKTVLLVLGDNNIKLQNLGRFHKTIFCNEYFFDNLNPVSSYWLGFIAADGCLTERDKGIKIALSIKDKAHIRKFKRIMDTNDKISEHKKTKSVRVAVYSSKLFNRLNVLGIFPNKSLTIEKVNVPDSLISHFIRGVYDGDGSISGKDRSHIQLCIAGNKPFLRWIQEVLQRKCTLNKVKLYDIGKNNGAKRLQYTGSQIFKILDFLYQDSAHETRLSRKYDKYLSFKRKFLNS